MYRAEDIRVLEFDESVRTWPAMYFGAARQDRALVTEVVRGVLAHALHPATAVAQAHALRVHAEVSADLAFSVSDDSADLLNEQDMPRLGYYGSLLGRQRWLSAATAVLSVRATVQVWRNGRGFRQELAHLRPVGAPERFEAQDGSGTLVAFELDPGYFRPGSTIATDLTSLDLHGPYCTEPGGAGYVTIRDVRGRDNRGNENYGGE